MGYFKKNEFNRKTIQRDIQELVELNLVKQEGNWKSTVYSLIYKPEILKKIDVDKYFETDYLNRDVQTSFNFSVFDYLQEEIFTDREISELNKLQNEFIKNISKYDSQTLINKEYERIMIEFSWKSSSIEWNTYNLLNTEELIKSNIADPTKSKTETQMILNHKDAFNETIQNRDRFLNLNFGDIEYIHSILTKNLWITKNIRKKWVWVTWTKYKPLDNEFQIKDATEKMISLINEKEFFIEKAFLALLLISYIQPFEDGNKRTARMLSNAILLSYGSIPLSYRVVDNVEYKKATILFYEINNIFYFKEIFINQFRSAVKEFFK